MSEKMRESFEGWAKSESMYLGLDVKGNYINTTTHLTWIGWQASRAALVVELPPEMEERFIDSYQEGWNDAISSCEQRIEDCGVSYK